ncbi:MAG: NUDIX hydrolase [Acidimicrobiia bacterium]|nr:NUDIX hydrolase [Acidimicrobiia bacterium]
MTRSSSPPTGPVLAVGAVVAVDHHLLLVTRANPPARGQWTIPGGRVEPGESLADAVVREVAEETGLDVECGPLVGWVERIGTGFHFVIFDFRADPIGVATGLNGLAPTAGDDAGDARWVPFDELPTMDLVPGLLDFLQGNGIVDPR